MLKKRLKPKDILIIATSILLTWLIIILSKYEPSITLIYLYEFFSGNLKYGQDFPVNSVNLAGQLSLLTIQTSELIIIVLIIFSIPAIRNRKFLCLNKFKLKSLLSLIAIILVYYLIVGMNYYFIGNEVTSTETINRYRDPLYILSRIFIAVIIGPILEELIFRGVILNGLKRTVLGLYPAVIISSILFAITHIHANTISLMYHFIFGIFMALVVVRYKSLYLAIILHAFYNAIILVFLTVSA